MDRAKFAMSDDDLEGPVFSDQMVQEALDKGAAFAGTWAPTDTDLYLVTKEYLEYLTSD